MNKIVTLLIVTAFCASAAFAQGLTLGGEVKTGVFWTKTEEPNKDAYEKVSMHSQNDDAGDYEGRFRLNMDYINEAGTLGFKARVQWQDFTHERNGPEWPFAFGFGNFFDNQLTMAIGRLGGSPWGTGGPEMWKELESPRSGGVRFEFKPAFIPEQFGKLNVGFVLNGPDSYTDAGMTRAPNLVDVLLESVIGLSYTHDFFMVRFSYRLDSEQDVRNRGTSGKEGDSVIYRVEERALKNLLPGAQIWAIGYIEGVGAEKETFVDHKNWLFLQYAPPNFTAQVRLGLEGSADRNILFAKPNFYYKFFDGLIEAGALFGIAQDFGTKVYPGSPYSYMEMVPKVQVNFAPGAYAAFEYYYKLEYAYRIDPPFKQTQWMNLRFGIYY